MQVKQVKEKLNQGNFASKYWEIQLTNLLTNMLLKDLDQFISIWMTVLNSLLQDQLEIHLRDVSQNKGSENINFSRLKISASF